MQALVSVMNINGIKLYADNDQMIHFTKPTLSQKKVPVLQPMK